MAATLTVRDETPAGGVTNEWSLEFLDETISVRDLIRERVYQEVQDYNVKQQAVGPYRGLVQPEGLEQALAGRKPRLIDWKKQYDKAVEAFETSRVLVLIDDKQAESLDQSFTIGTNTAVTFLRLTLLVGG
ncbi:hypothetical protein [Paludisphaera mucosa]|uniref:Uncharacterized protein n=1 Tax=Paludisphaera mucosa TaxID=3030827 RepID=A0ABT6F3U4_9BACT|nr:hypothetical protein [Paludisphaera mucosa]MDG3002214.1 hypothetical protein [Paludisphaera mucosa]